MVVEPKRFARSCLAGGLAALAASMAMTGDNLSAVGGAPAAAAELRAISSRLDAAHSTVMIEASAPVAYVASRPDPQTIVVDLRDVAAGVLAQTVGPLPPITGVDVEETTASDGVPVARVRVKMDRAAAHRVRSSRNVIFVEVERDAAAPKVAKVTKDAKDPAITSGGAVVRTMATAITGVRPVKTPGGVAIALAGNGELIASKAEQSRDLPARVWLDFPGVMPGAVSASTSINMAGVQRVRVGVNSREPLVTRVVIDLAQQMPYRVESAGQELHVIFGDAPEMPGLKPGPSGAVSASEMPGPSNAAAAPDVSVIRPEGPGSSPGISSAPGNETAQNTSPAQPANTSPMAPPLGAQVPTPVLTEPQAPAAPATTRFQGPPASFDFQDADLRSVLRTFAEISQLNIVIDPSVQGRVDVALRDVPWDQALDIILRANKLGYTVDGTVVRIAPLATLAQEAEESRKLNEAKALAGDLQVLTVPLSYAKAPELVSILTKSALSLRGEVQVDTRTNTLIIRDLPDRLTTAADLVKALDRPQPQVEIEARIVQTNRDFARSIGVQWGFNGRVDPALGNTTNLAFPNSGSLTGRTGGVQGPVQGETAADRGVNLGVPGATSALGIALGAVNGAVNLDVVLSQLERTGRGRLLSTPRVSTQNNVEAEMTQGVQIPIQQVANNTVTVNFKDAALTLKVTPQITASNTIIMRVFLENASPDFSRSVNNIPPIDTQRAVTTVLVADGETTVIGGIYISREQATQGRVPLLHRVPLLGWLFKRDEISDESRELLIFITPRITQR